MKIISKYKDYYDFLTGVHGEDPKIILDRRAFTNPILISPQGLSIYICGMLYQGWYKDGKFYWGEDLWKVGKKDSELPRASWYRRWFRRTKRERIAYIKSTFGSDWYSINLDPVIDKDKYNEKESCPIIMAISSIDRNPTFIRYPVLRELDFAKRLSAQDIYLMLSEWLAPKDNVVDTRSNTEKILSAGFDKKTSFRNIK